MATGKIRRPRPAGPDDFEQYEACQDEIEAELSLAAAKEGDPYQFQLPATEYEMVLDPSLNQGLPQGDSGIEPPFWSNATVWYHERDVPGSGSVFRVVTVESALSRYVVIRSTASELEAAQFTSLILDCKIHPNALPQRIH